MSCLNGNIRVVDAAVYGVMEAVGAPIVGDISFQTPMAQIAPIGTAMRGCIAVNAGLAGTIGEVCLANGDYVIRWSKPLLEWVGDDNREGVVKYNELTSSHDWELEEVIIEELL